MKLEGDHDMKLISRLLGLILFLLIIASLGVAVLTGTVRMPKALENSFINLGLNQAVDRGIIPEMESQLQTYFGLSANDIIEKSDYNLLEIANGFIELPSFESQPNSVIRNPDYDVNAIQHESTYETDYNLDGFSETVLYYKAGKLVASKSDTNGDLAYDVQTIFEENTSKYQYVDSNGSGSYDQIMKLGEAGTYDYMYPMYKKSPNSTGDYNPVLIQLLVASGVVLILKVLIRLMRKRKSKSMQTAATLLIITTLLMNLTLSPVYADDVYNEDGSINDSYFDDNWAKYSTVDDERIPVQSRSWTSQEIARVRAKMNTTIENIRLLTFEEELLEQHLQVAIESRNAVRTNLKNNLLKSLMRLTISTGMTIKKGVDLGKGMSDLLVSTAEFSMEAAGSTASGVVEIGKQATDYLLFVLEFQVPSAEQKAAELRMTGEEKKIKKQDDARYDDAKTAYGLAKSIKGSSPDEMAANFIAETMKVSLGKLNKAMEVPKVEITDADAQILASQNKIFEKLDAQVAMTEASLAHLRVELDKLYAEVDKCLDELDRLYAREKKNTRLMLLDNWKRQQEDKEDEEETEEEYAALDGTWEGELVFETVHRTFKYSDAEMSAMLNTRIPLEFSLSKTDQQFLTTYTPRSLVLNETQFHDGELTISHSERVVGPSGKEFDGYIQLDATVSIDGSFIEGYYTFGTMHEGPEVSGYWYAYKIQ